MDTNINENMVQVVILDISGIYTQIHNQGYFDKCSIDEIKNNTLINNVGELLY